ncbi:MAG: hypothetical protein FIA93_11490 [Deltaproteobacteria bacterium]|nr:hypothetical protein [Deltaproteobacteria bacterium]
MSEATARPVTAAQPRRGTQAKTIKDERSENFLKGDVLEVFQCERIRKNFKNVPNFPPKFSERPYIKFSPASPLLRLLRRPTCIVDSASTGGNAPAASAFRSV